MVGLVLVVEVKEDELNRFQTVYLWLETYRSYMKRSQSKERAAWSSK